MARPIFAASVIVVLLGLGCGSVEEAPPGVQPAPATGPSVPSDFSVELGRTACRGTCPVYQVTVNGAGQLVFRGQENVAKPGTHQEIISPEVVAELVQAVQAADFFNLSECYCQERIFDVPTSAITVTLNGTTHTVRHLKGNEAPEQLLTLEATIDRLTRTEKWVKGP